jgi:hypothetical protein
MTANSTAADRSLLRGIMSCSWSNVRTKGCSVVNITYHESSMRTGSRNVPAKSSGYNVALTLSFRNVPHCGRRDRTNLRDRPRLRGAECRRTEIFLNRQRDEDATILGHAGPGVRSHGSSAHESVHQQSGSIRSAVRVPRRNCQRFGFRLMPDNYMFCLQSPHITAEARKATLFRQAQDTNPSVSMVNGIAPWQRSRLAGACSFQPTCYQYGEAPPKASRNDDQRPQQSYFRNRACHA